MERTMGSQLLSRIALAGLLAVGPLPAGARAADGDLDPTFGSGGKVVTNFNLPASAAGGVAIQADGKIVAAGFTYDEEANVDFGAARYEPDGTLDPTFDSDGRVTTDFFGLSDVANALAIQSDGKIVLAGSAMQNLANDFALVRYNPDGSLDSTFDGDGKVTTDFSGGGDIAYGVVIQPDGKILAVGVSNNFASSADVAIVRYNGDGSLDPTFGVGGRVLTDVSGAGEVAFGVVLQPDAKIVVVGLAERTNSATSDCLILRYGSNGILDPTFGSNGVVLTSFLVARSVALGPEGKIVIAGVASDPANPGGFFAVARYLKNGALDASFDGDGWKTTDLPGFDESAAAVSVQPDGKVLAAGFSANPDFSLDFALLRYNIDGTDDLTFGALGRVITDFAGRSDGARGIALQTDGKIVLAGSSVAIGFNPDFALARYINSVGPVGGGTCARSAGFWKKHPELWPVSSLVLGDESYTAVELQALLSRPPKGDASLILGSHLIAAKLNAAGGAGSDDLKAVIGSADGLLTPFSGKLPYKVSQSSSQGQAMVHAAGDLSRRNDRDSTRDCGRP
jgi:uncharacterized delta-60 repeat protein